VGLHSSTQAKESAKDKHLWPTDAEQQNLISLTEN